MIIAGGIGAQFGDRVLSIAINISVIASLLFFLILLKRLNKNLSEINLDDNKHRNGKALIFWMIFWLIFPMLVLWIGGLFK